MVAGGLYHGNSLSGRVTSATLWAAEIVSNHFIGVRLNQTYNNRVDVHHHSDDHAEPIMDTRDKAKAIIAAIIEQAGGRFHGKTRLYKAFYVAHLLHFRDREGVLSDYPIVRLPRGPALDAGDSLLGELAEHNILQLTQQPAGPFLEEVFTLLQPSGGLTTEEIDSIHRAVEWIGDKSATELSEWTHEYSNTWQETANGQEMNIYADLMTQHDYAEMKKRHETSGELVDAVFAE